jgi:hypothetical protein
MHLDVERTRAKAFRPAVGADRPGFHAIRLGRRREAGDHARNRTTGRVGGVFEMTSSANAYVSYSRGVQPTTQLVSLDGTLQELQIGPRPASHPVRAEPDR